MSVKYQSNLRNQLDDFDDDDFGTKKTRYVFKKEERGQFDSDEDDIDDTIVTRKSRNVAPRVRRAPPPSTTRPMQSELLRRMDDDIAPAKEDSSMNSLRSSVDSNADEAPVMSTSFRVPKGSSFRSRTSGADVVGHDSIGTTRNSWASNDSSTYQNRNRNQLDMEVDESVNKENAVNRSSGSWSNARPPKSPRPSTCDPNNNDKSDPRNRLNRNYGSNNSSTDSLNDYSSNNDYNSGNHRTNDNGYSNDYYVSNSERDTPNNRSSAAISGQQSNVSSCRSSPNPWDRIASTEDEQPPQVDGKTISPSTSFSDYSDDMEANGEVLPRKSGKYDDGSMTPSSTVDKTPSNEEYAKWGMPLVDDATASAVVAKPNISYVLKAHAHGLKTEHVQCVIVRDRKSIHGKMYPTYELILEDTKKKLILAKKMNMNRTSNYHMFDMTRGQIAGAKLTKKSGNYLGKLRATNMARTEYTLINQNCEREEIAGVMFDKPGLLNHIKEGSLPRKVTVVVPHLDSNKTPIPNRVKENGEGSIVEAFRAQSGFNRVLTLESKEPVFDNGNYRLNFRGRVSVPSVKNFQLVSRDNIDNVICQFGKVGEDRFHLDFKSPLNAFQAFAFAISQFNL